MKHTVWLSWIAVAVVGCAPPAVEPDVMAGQDRAVAALAEDGVPAELIEGRGDPQAFPAARLDKVYYLDYFVRVGAGRRVHVTEAFSLRSWLRHPRRGMLLLPGTLSRGSFYNLDVDGYRFQEVMAQRGFFVFAIDYEGSGESTYPDDGFEVTHAFLVEEGRQVLRQLARRRGVPKMDVLGESNGGSVASELCDDDERVRSCVMASMIYREGTAFFNQVFYDPGFLAYIRSQPNGYIQAGPEMYFNIAAGVSPEVAAAILATQPGLYAVPPLLEHTSMPWFDPSHARVPGLIIQGTEDNIGTQADSDLLAADYGSAPDGGGVATIVRIPGGAHIPRVEPAPVNQLWLDAVLDFVDP